MAKNSFSWSASMQQDLQSTMQRGYILHTRAYQDGKSIVHLLIDGFGRVDALVRLGNGKRSLRAIVQPFQPLLLQLTGKHELKNVSLIEPYSAAIPLQGQALYASLYLNELMMRVLKHGGEQLFLPYHQTLMTLALNIDEPALRYFEKSLLEELGCLPNLRRDVQGNDIQAAVYYALDPEHGFQPLAHQPHRAYLGQSLLNLADQQLQLEDYAAIKQLMRQLLAPLLGSKPLLSRQLFKQSLPTKPAIRKVPVDNYL